MLEEVRVTISDFLGRKDVDYALMLNGVWGAGKTYFVQNSLNVEFKKAHFSPVYVSLNGVGSFEEVAVQVVFGTGWRASKTVAKAFLLPFAMRYLPEKSVAAMLSALQTGSEKKTRGWLGWLHTSKDLSPKTHVLILDDIERVSEIEKNLVPIMGRVFDEFISRGYHVVFIGDETHIDFPKFKEEKEKYIRRTITFKPDIGAVVDAIACSFTGAVKKRYAKLSCDNLKFFATTFEIDNIRVIKRIMDDFVSIAERINDLALISQVKHILMFRLAPIVAELAAGRLTRTDEATLSGLQNIGAARSAKLFDRFYSSSSSETVKIEDDKKKKSFAQLFVEQYDERLPVHWNYDECIVKFALDGTVDQESLMRTISNWTQAMGDQYTTALDKIWRFEEIEDSEFEENCLIVENGLTNGRYNAESVRLACSLLEHFNDKGLRILQMKDLVDSSVRGLRNRWEKVPDDYINPMLLNGQVEDRIQPIIDAARQELSRRKRTSAEEDVSSCFTMLDKHFESARPFFEHEGVWQILGKIVLVDKCKELCDLSNRAISTITANLKYDKRMVVGSNTCADIQRLIPEVDAKITECEEKNLPLKKHVLEKLRIELNSSKEVLENTLKTCTKDDNGQDSEKIKESEPSVENINGK